MFTTSLPADVQERLGPSLSLAQDSFRAQHPGKDWYKDCDAAERVIRMNAWSLARDMRPDKLLDSEKASYEAGLRAAAKAGSLKGIDANLASKMGEYAKASRDALRTSRDSTPNVGAQGVQGHAQTQILAAVPNFEHLAPRFNAAIDIGADTQEFYRIERTGAGVWADDESAQAGEVRLSNKGDSRRVSFNLLNLSSGFRDQARAARQGFNLESMLREAADQAIATDMTQVVFGGQDALGWPSLLAQGTSLATVTTDLAAASPPTAASVVGAILDACAAVRERGREVIKPNRVGIGPALYSWLLKTEYGSGNGKTALEWLMTQLALRGLSGDAIREIDELDDPVNSKTRAVFTFADGDAGGSGVFTIANRSPIIVPWQDNRSRTMLITPCAGAYGRYSTAIASAVFSHSKLAAKS